jgi:epidermal growth factor receptor substrate 15
MAFSLIQTAKNGANANSSTLVLTFGANVTAGNAVIIGINMNTPITLSSVSDGAGNTYTAVPNVNGTGTGQNLYLFYSSNITGGFNTVTLHISSTGWQVEAIAREYSGISPSSPIVDQSKTGTISALTSWSSGNMSTTTNANDLLVAIAANANSAASSFSAGSGYGNLVLQNAESSFDIAMEDQVVNTTGAYAGTFTANNLGTGAVGVVAFVGGYIINVSDSITTSDVVAQYYSDQVFTIDTPHLTVVSNVNKSDSITTSETVNVSVALSINVSDSITTSESIATLEASTISVSDSITTSETLKELVTSFINPISNVYTLTANYDQSHQNGTDAVDFSVSPGLGETFTATGGMLGKVTYELKGSGANSGNMVAKLYSSPNGTLLATSNNFDTSILTTSFQLIDFIFSGANQVSLANGTSYFVTIEPNGTGSGTVNVGVDFSGGYAGGAGYFKGGTWGALSDDLIFYIYTISQVNGEMVQTSEIVSLFYTLYLLSISDSTTASEALTIAITDFVSVSDTVSTGESISLQEATGIAVSDSITISETIPNPNISYSISVSDSTTASESVSTQVAFAISVSDGATTSESVPKPVVSYSISISDSITTSEAISFFTNPLNLFISDSVTLSEIVLFIAPIVIVETVTTQDFVGQYYTDEVDSIDIAYVSITSFISVSENVSTSETLHVAQAYAITISDNVATSETLKLDFPLLISLTDGRLTDEAGNFLTDENGDILTDGSNFELLSTSESVSVLSISNVNVSESVSHTETVATQSTISILVSDNVTVSESVSFAVINRVSVVETSTTSETVNVAQADQISVSDSSTTSESVGLLYSINISTSNSVTVSEQIILLNFEFISVTDNIATSDTPTLLIPTLFISVSDMALADEAVLVNTGGGIVTFDNIGTSETLALHTSVPDSVFSDSITVSETIKLTISSFVNKSESAIATEAVAVYSDENITVSETIGANDVVNMLVPTLLVAVSDSTLVSESTGLEVDSFILVQENSSVTESSGVIFGSKIIISEAAIISENVTLQIITSLSFADSIATSEIVSVKAPLLVSKSENITTIENLNVFIPELFVTVFDNVAISDSLIVGQVIFFYIEDDVVTSDNVNVAPQLVAAPLDITLYFQAQNVPVTLQEQTLLVYFKKSNI